MEAERIADMENKIMSWNLVDLQGLRKELIKDNYQVKP